MSRYLMTHSLLGSWLRSMQESKFDEGDDPEKETALEEFMHTLRREPSKRSPAMQSGIDFENLVTAILTGQQKAEYHSTSKDGTQTLHVYDLPEHPWYAAAFKVAQMVDGAKLQYVAKKEVTVCRMDLLLYGRLDAMKEGRIFDIKFSGSYERGKFHDSTQHPMYYRLVPEIMNFTYVVSNGYDVWTEVYWFDEIPRIEPVITDFLQWLQEMNLMDTYKEYWGALK